MGGVAAGWGWPPWTRSGPRRRLQAVGVGAQTDVFIHREKRGATAYSKVFKYSLLSLVSCNLFQSI